MRSANRTGLVSGTGLIVTGLTATLLALAFPIWSYEDRAGTGVNTLNAETVSTQFGPLSELDREFITKVRLAGLWELPAGQQAEERGTTQAVRTAGEHLVDGHRFLDSRVLTVAAQLGVKLPSQPTEQQSEWLATLDAAKGVDYDRKFANIVRAAHGKVFTLVAEVRASTRNSLVRDLAEDANTTVLDHMKVLEATGYVDFDALAETAATATPPPITASPALPGPAQTPGSPIPVTPSTGYTLPPAASRADSSSPP